GIELFQHQVPAFHRGTHGRARFTPRDSSGLYPRRRRSRIGGGTDSDPDVAVLHPSAGAAHCPDHRGGLPHGAGVFPGRLHVCGLRPQFRWHLHRPDLRADTADLPGWGVLFDQSAARLLAGRVTDQPYPAYGQRLPLRNSGGIGHQYRDRPGAGGGILCGPVPAQLSLAGTGGWPRELTLRRLASGRGTGMLADSQEGEPQMHPAEQSPLGKTSEYSGIYTPSLLYPIPRQPIWEGLGLDPQRLPFHGADVWNSYEVSWL